MVGDSSPSAQRTLPRLPDELYAAIVGYTFDPTPASVLGFRLHLMALCGHDWQRVADMLCPNALLDEFVAVCKARACLLNAFGRLHDVTSRARRERPRHVAYALRSERLRDPRWLLFDDGDGPSRWADLRPRVSLAIREHVQRRTDLAGLCVALHETAHVATERQCPFARTLTLKICVLLKGGALATRPIRWINATPSHEVFFVNHMTNDM